MEASHVGVACNQDGVITNQVVAGGCDIQGEGKGDQQRDGQPVDVLAGGKGSTAGGCFREEGGLK